MKKKFIIIIKTRSTPATKVPPASNNNMLELKNPQRNERMSAVNLKEYYEIANDRAFHNNAISPRFPRANQINSGNNGSQTQGKFSQSLKISPSDSNLPPTISTQNYQNCQNSNSTWVPGVNTLTLSSITSKIRKVSKTIKISISEEQDAAAIQSQLIAFKSQIENV